MSSSKSKNNNNNNNINKRHSRSRSRERENSENSYHRHRRDSSPSRHHHRYHEDIKIYISNLSSNVSQHKIKDEFNKYGYVYDLVLKKKNGKSSNYFGFVIMSKKTDTEHAIKNIQKKYDCKLSLYEKESNDNKEKKDDIFSDSSNSDNEASTNKEKSGENANSNLVPKSVKVREIWIGNLPDTITKEILYKTFFIYGEISSIDIHKDKNYAFIKYRLISSASRAYEKCKNSQIDGKILKISFSNSGKKKEIVGDEKNYVLSEKNCKLIHVSLSKNSTIPNENVIREIFEQYGKIKEINTKNTGPNFRPSIYVEFAKNEDAVKCISELNKKENQDKKSKLGDQFCEIDFYFKKKNYENNNNNNNNFNNNNNNINLSSGALPNNNLMFNNNLLVNNNMRRFPIINPYLNPMNPMLFNMTLMNNQKDSC